MPPKTKITRQGIVEAAVRIVREQGPQALNARNVASALQCSTQPIFSNFASMEQLRLAVVTQADQLCQAYIQEEVESGQYPAYKASGMAYIRFAKEERELFQLLYMRDRSREVPSETPLISKQMDPIVRGGTGLDGEVMELFHLEIWAFVHGIAAMFATGFLNLDWELISKMLTDAYQGLKKQYEMEQDYGRYQN